MMLSGRARITAIDLHGHGFVDDVGEGDLWFFPAGIPHSIQGLPDGCEFLLVFDDGGFSENATFSICDWLAHTPDDVVAKNVAVAAEEPRRLPGGERYLCSLRKRSSSASVSGSGARRGPSTAWGAGWERAKVA
jgi:oxalate decarboxylase